MAARLPAASAPSTPVDTNSSRLATQKARMGQSTCWPRVAERIVGMRRGVCLILHRTTCFLWRVHILDNGVVGNFLVSHTIEIRCLGLMPPSSACQTRSALSDL